MADVRHEIGADGVEASTFADVVDRDQGAAVFERDRLDREHRSWRPDELDVLTTGGATDCSPDVTLDGLIEQHRGVSVVGPGGNVLDQGLTTSIGEHHTDRKRIECPPESKDLGLQSVVQLAGLVTFRLEYDIGTTTTKRHHGVPSPSWTVPTRGISPVSSERSRKR